MNYFRFLPCVFCIGASLAVNFSVSSSAFSQTLKETEIFIKENFAISSSSSSLENNYLEISCQRISGSFVYDDGSSESVYFSPSEVEYSAHTRPNGETSVLLTLTCISGKCIKKFRSGKSDPEFRSVGFMSTIVEPKRVLSALLHHQKLCGGKIKTPF